MNEQKEEKIVDLQRGLGEIEWLLVQREHKEREVGDNRKRLLTYKMLGIVLNLMDIANDLEFRDDD